MTTCSFASLRRMKFNWNWEQPPSLKTDKQTSWKRLCGVIMHICTCTYMRGRGFPRTLVGSITKCQWQRGVSMGGRGSTKQTRLPVLMKGTNQWRCVEGTCSHLLTSHTLHRTLAVLSLPFRAIEPPEKRKNNNKMGKINKRDTIVQVGIDPF